MPKVCCKLHRVLDSHDFSSSIKNEKFQEFSTFIQQSWYKRSKTITEHENPNDMQVNVYMFAGAGTRYLSGLAGQFLTFQPRKQLKQAIKWYPIITTKKIPETKSLSYLGRSKLSIALLLFVSYEKNYLSERIYFQLHFHIHDHSTPITMFTIHAFTFTRQTIAQHDWPTTNSSDIMQ